MAVSKNMPDPSDPRRAGEDAPPDDSSAHDSPAPASPGCLFLAQWFFVPLLLVAILVLVWLMFSWLAFKGSSPEELVRGIKKLDGASWQKAYALSQLLRNPRYDDWKEDAGLARELSSVLEEQLRAGGMDPDRIRLRVFLCRALGEFRCREALPALASAAQLERDAAELDVRRSAVEAIAVLAENLGAPSLRADENLMDVLDAASREGAEGVEDGRRRAQLRSTAAFALGVIGGGRSRNRLAEMLADPYPDARYNAATGLSRHGDVRATAVLIEMLDPDNEQAVRFEEHSSGRDRKRIDVIINGIRSCVRLLERNPRGDYAELERVLEEFLQSNLDGVDSGARRALRLQAQEALHLFRSRGREAGVASSRND